MVIRSKPEHQGDMVHLQHEDTNVHSHTGPLLHPEEEPGLEPLAAADILPHPHPRVQGQGLAGQPLLAGVGVGQGEGQVEQPGVPLPPPGPLQRHGQHPGHPGAGRHHQAEVLLLRADGVSVDPKCRILLLIHFYNHHIPDHMGVFFLLIHKFFLEVFGFLD